MLPLSRSLILSLVGRTSRKVQSIQTASISSSAARFSADDWLHTVGPYPRTREERERCAKKYNLIPEDYEPYEEGEALGDYPKLKAVGAYNRDWYDDFDDPIDYRFYGEPYHRDADLYRWERIDPKEGHRPEDVADWKKASVFLAMVLLLPSVITIFKTFKINIGHQHKLRQPEPNRAPFDQKYYDFPSPNGEDIGHHH